MKDKIQKLIAEIIGDGFTVEVKPVSGGNVSSDFGAGVTTYLSFYTDGEGFHAIYVNGKLELQEYTIYGPDVVRVADGRLVRMRSAVVDESVGKWPENESELIDMIGGHQSGVDAEAAIGAPDKDGLVLRSEWNAKEGCFESSRVEPEKSQVPQVGEYVILPCGSLGRVSAHRKHRKNIYCMVEGTNTAFAPGCLKPWIPKEGDKVRVSPCKGVDCDQVDIVEGFDTPTQIVFLVGRPHGVELKLLSPYIEPKAPADHNADATKTANPSVTPDSSWTPKCGDWVKISKPPASERIVRWFWRSEIDCLDGETHKITRISEGVNAGYQVREIDGSGLWLALSWLTPAEPPTDYIPDANKKVPGDLLVGTTVKLNNESQSVPSLSGWTLDVDPDAYIGVITIQVASTMPNGWMILHADAKTEPRAIGDRFFRVTKGHWEELTLDNIDQANAQSWAAIRKIPSVVVKCQELLGSKVEYREPTNDDIGKRVEVRDSEKSEWIDLIFVVILPPGDFRFCAEDDRGNRCGWRFARIKAC